MPGYEVQIAAIRAAGRAAESAGEQASAVDLAGVLGGALPGLPGGRAADAMNRLAEVWRAQITGWSGEAKALAESM